VNRGGVHRESPRVVPHATGWYMANGRKEHTEAGAPDPPARNARSPTPIIANYGRCYVSIESVTKPEILEILRPTIKRYALKFEYNLSRGLWEFCGQNGIRCPDNIGFNLVCTTGRTVKVNIVVAT